MIAGLPMYERPELFQAHDNFWQLIHKQIDGSPQKLSRKDLIELLFLQVQGTQINLEIV